ncbi:CAAX amino terminal protease self- immunity [Oxobacter pfennigii]|uniref:CAAX amino terminal protease self-immunity n=1 Tax=Oxobacter pfennigii TaxID=36849 RepID=A0A0P8W9F8_9CLOT|nr:CPBP family intramembrane glutamic endopeptidase [Oxobacter pfennigii]KPU44315.1 CAAX amino terminal protease self- immunity [Oxobacter pfennigii]
MDKLKVKQNRLLMLSIVLVIALSLLALLVGNIMSKAAAYIFISIVYWGVFCIPLSLYYLGGANGIEKLHEKQPVSIPSGKKMLIHVLVFMPCIATLFVVFIPTISVAPIQVFAISMLYAIMNGTIEELYWRGVFTNIFPDDILKSYILPTLMFGLWHIALYFIKGMEYHGGLIALVGGATFMGFLWGYAAYKTKSIRAVTAAHIITNFFAFSGMIYMNWFV